MQEIFGRIGILILIFQLNSTIIHCQSFSKRDIVLGLTVGTNHLNKDYTQRQTQSESFQKNFKGSVEVKNLKGLHPVSVKYEYGLSSRWGIGFTLTWWNVKYTMEDSYKQGTLERKDIYNIKVTSISLGARANYHFLKENKKDDLYAGCSLGITRNDAIVNFSTTSTNSSSGFANSYFEMSYPVTLYLAPTVGLRHYFTDNFGLVAECGYEKGAFLLAGVFFRFRPGKYDALKYS